MRATRMPLIARRCFIAAKARVDLIALSSLWLVMVAAVDPLGDFPLRDDWAYGVAVRGLLNQGVYRIPDFVSANLGPLVNWGALFCWPFGFSFTALRISTLVFGWVGVVGVYFLFREVWVDRRLAFLAAVTVLVNPIYFALANSFMTDVPFVALISLALAAIVRGLRRDDRRALIVGLGLGLVAVLVRQFALVVLAGFACAWLARRGLRARAIVTAFSPLVAGIALHYAFNQWLVQTGRKGPPAGISDITTASLGEFAYSSAHELFNAINEIGLFLLPIAIVCLSRSSHTPTRSSGRWPVPLAIAVGAALTWFMVSERLTMPLDGDTLQSFGIGPLMLRDMLLIGWHLPPSTAAHTAFWMAMTALAVVGATLIVLAVARGSAGLFDSTRSIRASIVRAWPAIFFAVTGLGYVLILLLLATRHTLFDRYLLPLALIVALALPALRARPPTTDAKRQSAALAFACLFLVASACYSVIGTHDFLAWNRTRWMALDDLMTKQGVSPHRIDGGYEFNGWFLYDPLYEPHDEKSWWWVDDDEYMIAAGPMPSYRIERRLAVDRWGAGTAPDVFVLHRDDEAQGFSRTSRNYFAPISKRSFTCRQRSLFFATKLTKSS